MEITQATPADAAVLTSLIAAAYAGYTAQGINLPPMDDGMPDDIASGRVWAAWDGAVVVGVLILSIEGLTAHLQNVAVHPDHKGHGLGGALIRKAISLAQSAGCSTLSLVTHTAMPDNISIYQKLGWFETRREAECVHMNRAL